MSQSDKIPGLGGRGDVVAPVAQVDLSRLTPEERSVLASIGPSASIGEVLARSGLGERTASVLLALRVKGAIAPLRVSAPALSPAAGSPAASASLEEELAEPVELELERKREILELERALGARNHFELLGLVPGATTDEVKRAFHEASRRYHPDRFFGKNLGSFKGRLERIFRRLTEANAVLSDPDRREAYVKASPALAAAAPGSALRALEPEEEARAAERRGRMSRHPYLAQARKATELLAQAKSSLSAGEFDRAISSLKLLASLDPKNKEAPELLREARRLQEAGRGKQELEAGQRAEAEAAYDRAAAAYRNASNLDPQNAHAAARAAMTMLRAGEDVNVARSFAQRAVDVEPRNASYRALLGRLLLDGGAKRLAKKEFEKAIELEPAHAEAKEQLRKLRWTF